MPEPVQPPVERRRRVLSTLDAGGFLRWAAVARSSFASARAEIDALNVFPVPDGDTGTNLYLTLDAALDAARTAISRDIPIGSVTMPSLQVMCREMSRAMLLTARGNSGVILSQLFRGFAEHVVDTGSESLDGAGLAGAFARADHLAWRAVTEPKEGTILSVSRAVATVLRARVDAQPGMPLADAITLAASTAAEALERTPSQLPALARAGVVDAGGAGYLLLIEALARVIQGQPPQADDDPLRRHLGWSRPVVPARAHAAASGDDGGEGPAYEVMYLLSDSDEERVGVLRARLASLGDSLLIVGAEGTWNVHVHVDDPGAAIEAGVEAGRPHRIVVTHFGDQIRHAPDPAALAVVACAAGEGIAEVFRAAGATVVMSGPGRRASAGQVLEAIRASGAGQVIVLPNDGDTEMAAQAAARAAVEGGQQVRVVRSRTAVQGIAALAVFDAQTDLETNAEAMTEASAATRHGAVTISRKEALTSAGVCHVGDVLGVVQGDFAIIGSDLYDVAGQVVEMLLGDDGELLTVISGDDAPADLASAVVAAARIRRRDLEVTFIHGMQPLYPLLLGVE
ncbi:MAG: DAK2 domain-containing protein [Actinomycetales bacterium]|nr:DAK2 domain-containing protein [Candidatus Phosphoribacter baldrii]